VGIAVTVLLAANGYQYYSTPVEERFFQLQHNSLKPSGFLGHGVGIIGSLMMTIGVAIYMIRKRMRKLFNLGYLKHWLELHIFLCSVGPVLVLYHTAFKFGGIVAVSFWSMIAVVLSGVVGRFIYVRIPRTIQGKELDIKQLNEMSSDISTRLSREISSSENIIARIENITKHYKYRSATIGQSILLMINDYFDIRKTLLIIKEDLKQLNIPHLKVREIMRLAGSKIIISRRIALLQTMQKIFRYWHIIHLPFAITMFIIMFIHVIITIVFGYKWIF
jgi:hypothetical protein